MNLSLDEYRALVAKAFRGVGYPWGLTEDASWAARRLAEFDASSPEAVLVLLESLDATVPNETVPNETVPNMTDRMPSDDWTCTGDALCPICVGTTILDRGPTALANPLTLGPTLAPTLLAPFLAETMGSDPQTVGSDPITLSWETGSCTISPNRIDFHGNRCALAEFVTITVTSGSDPTPSGQAKLTRVILEPDQIQRLQAFAGRTYAPATDVSRAGAGAGTTDND